MRLSLLVLAACLAGCSFGSNNVAVANLSSVPAPLAQLDPMPLPGGVIAESSETAVGIVHQGLNPGQALKGYRKLLELHGWSFASHFVSDQVATASASRNGQTVSIISTRARDGGILVSLAIEERPPEKGNFTGMSEHRQNVRTERNSDHSGGDLPRKNIPNAPW